MPSFGLHQTGREEHVAVGAVDMVEERVGRGVGVLATIAGEGATLMMRLSELVHKVLPGE